MAESERLSALQSEASEALRKAQETSYFEATKIPSTTVSNEKKEGSNVERVPVIEGDDNELNKVDDGVVADLVNKGAWFSGAVAESLRVWGLRLTFRVGTIKRRSGALGAKTPW